MLRAVRSLAEHSSLGLLQQASKEELWTIRKSW